MRILGVFLGVLSAILIEVNIGQQLHESETDNTILSSVVYKICSL